MKTKIRGAPLFTSKDPHVGFPDVGFPPWGEKKEEESWVLVRRVRGGEFGWGVSFFRTRHRPCPKN